MAVAATGFFDGVHLGHRSVLARLRSEASARGEESIVVTFWPHPRMVINPGDASVRLLNSLEEKVKIIRSLGIDRVEVFPFDREFSLVSARDFVTDYLKVGLNVTALVVGFDHRLGHDSFSSGEEMRAVIESCGVRTLPVEEFTTGSGHINSTVIRSCLSRGDMESVSNLLGYDYSLEGTLEEECGKLRLVLKEPLKIVPPEGKYEVSVLLPNFCYISECVIDGENVLLDSPSLRRAAGSDFVKVKFSKGWEL